MPLYPVRVRGIYATALAVLYAKAGFLLSDASEVLRGRLARHNIATSGAPPAVTVKSLDDSPDEVLVIGYPWEAGESAERALVEAVGYASIRRGRLGLYTVVDALSLGGCVLKLPGGLRGRLDSSECPPEGRYVRATVVREALEPGSEPLLRPGVRVIGEYLMIHKPGSGFSFSEHIPPERRADLVAATAGVDANEYHIHFRSAARSAPLEAVREEASKLAGEAARLLEEAGGAREPRVVARGEYISIVYLPRPAKEALDRLRSEVEPTINGHHTLKAGGRQESLLVDFAEEALKAGSCTRAAGEAAEAFIARSLQGRRVTIDHRRPDGARIRLGPFTVSSAAAGGSVRLVLERVFTKPGVLDGLGVEKRPGDRSYTRLDTSKWHVIHEYRSRDGRLLGVYANINTPPEVSFSGIRYLDLYIDVVMKPGSEPEIIDAEDLDKAVEDGLVTREIYRRAVEEAERLAKTLPGAYAQG